MLSSFSNSVTEGATTSTKISLSTTEQFDAYMLKLLYFTLVIIVSVTS